ncbi:MAG: NapC/NirT family cytochrome c [Candidatus Wallbacteria bacterium]|nr:NapC/NirT family cytochrome c [Candidatus Wallbacteria bacterium]
MTRLSAATLLATLCFFLVGFRIFQIRDGPRGTSNTTCADCHRALYREWQGSAHARAYKSDLFMRRSGGYTRGDCLPCHVPVTSQETPLTTRTWRQESGVDCVACHVLRSAARGPYDVDSAHRTVRDPAFLDNRACQQCHGNTAREMDEAPGPRTATTCQQCHMPVVKRHLAVGVYQLLRKKKKTGNHSFDLSELLRNAAELSWSYDDQTRTLSVVVRNSGAAHMLPTGNHGSPTVRLLVYLESDEPGKPAIRRVMTFSNKDGTALGPSGTATLEVPLQLLVPVRFTAHARLLFYRNDEVPEPQADVMAQKDFTFQYEPPEPK